MTQETKVDGKTEGPTEVTEPEPVEESPDLQSAPAVGKWPWQISAAIAAVALTAVLVVLAFGWVYIVQHNEAQERDDWEQLLGLIDRIQNIALFVLGALLGVSVTGAATKSAAVAADKNKKEAEKLHGVALQNMQAADNNKQVADLAVRDARAAATELASQISQTKKSSGQNLRERIGGEIPLVDLSQETSIGALRELVNNETGSYVVLPQSRLDDVPGVPDTSDAERMVSELRERWG